MVMWRLAQRCTYSITTQSKSFVVSCCCGYDTGTVHIHILYIRVRNDKMSSKDVVVLRCSILHSGGATRRLYTPTPLQKILADLGDGVWQRDAGEIGTGG